MRLPIPVRLCSLVLVLGSLVPVRDASADIIRIEILSRVPAANGQAFGPAGPYEIIRGRAFGEVDPSDQHNRIIQDIALAPRNARGRVEYVATFTLARPVDLARASGVLVYDVVNRGSGTVTPNAEGHISLVSGWQGDVAPTATNQTIDVPIARNADGTSITGSVVARFSNMAAGTTTLPIRLGSMGGRELYYRPADVNEAGATLSSHATETPEGVKTDVVRLPRSAWAFGDCSVAPFPGAPDPTQICLRGGFDATRMYELVYTAKDPLVLGLGLAATRDIVSFFRYAKEDRRGTANPVAGVIRHAVSLGNSQSGNFIKTFVHLGFNQDEGGRMVWDGVFPRIAARQTPINFRFALPGGAGTLYEPGSEPVLWWSRYNDATRGRPTASLLDRCTATRTCPKVIEAFGSAEFWGLRMSPGLIGTDARADIPLPDNVRRYYYPGTTHGGGRGGFRIDGGAPAGGCTLPANPNPQSDTTEALTAALIDWVVKGTPPPASAYPLLSRGELAPATRAAVRFPNVPHIPFADGRLNPVLDYDFGPAFVANDMAGILAQPPRIVQVIPTLVPVVDADGNETTGVASVLHQAPLGTYLGWNVTASGFFAGQVCGFQGGYVPFARTHAERLALNDPRPSVTERYGTLEGYVCTVDRAADAAVRNRFLLPAAAARLKSEARASSVLPLAAASTPDAQKIGLARCQAGL